MAKNNRFIAAAVLSFYVIAMLSMFVAGDCVLEIHVLSYSNPDNGCHDQASSGGCCDGTGDCNTGTRRCDTYFRFCLRPFNTLSTSRECATTALTSSHVQDDGLIDFTQPTFLGLDNPLLLSGLSTAWQGAQLYVEAIDRDSGGVGNDFIDSFAIDISGNLSVGVTLSSNTPGGILGSVYGYSRIALTSRVLCAKNYYGDRCQFLDEFNQCQFNNIGCNSRGTCVDGTLSYTCNCNPGYSGTDCELVNYCAGVLCNNNGICQNGADTYTCVCAAGFTGTDCEINVNECQGQNCGGNGRCVDVINSFTCVCDPGYTGSDCDIDINECDGQECNSNGQCVDLVDSFNCSCDPGYTGELCQTDINECVGVNCTGNGQCVDDINSFTCVCDPDYTGSDCDIDIQNKCDGQECNSNGQCVHFVDSFNCSCDPGYTGELCQTDINECVGVNCSGNGRCVDGINSFTCDCNPGYTGTLCEDIDDCVGVNCSGNGLCVDGVSNYSCLCQPGFSGNLCSVVTRGTSETLSPIIGGVLGAVVVLILVIHLVLIVTLIMKRMKVKHKEIIQGNPSDVDIELENNVGYDVSEQGADTIAHYYDYIDPTAIRARSEQIEDQHIDMNENVAYRVGHDNHAISSL